MNSSRDRDLEPEMFRETSRRRLWWRKWFPLVSGFVSLLVVLALVAASCDVVRAGPAGVEVEDCDAQDRANREPECGFTAPTRMPAAKTSPAGKPRPRATRGR